MKTRAAAAVMAVWSVCAAAGAHAYEPERFDLSVRLQIDRAITTAKLAKDILEEETSSIWRPYGVQIEWADGRSDADTMAGFALDVKLQPSIDGNRPYWTPVLGTACVDVDAPCQQPIRVSVDATENVLTLRKNQGSITGFVTNRDLARALGRVLAHEIGHVLLGAPYHDDAGLMRSAFLPNELAEPDRALFRLTCTDVARLATRLHVLTRDPRFAHRFGWTGPDSLDASSGIEGQELRAQCIQGRTVR